VRKEIQDRYYRVFTYQDVDRVPDIEFGYWPQTIRRWLREGMPLELTPKEQNDLWSRKLHDFFGFEQLYEESFSLRLEMNPYFEEQIIESKGNKVIKRDGTGTILEDFLVEGEYGSYALHQVPHRNARDWPAIKERFRFDDPVREIPAGRHRPPPRRCGPGQNDHDGLHCPLRHAAGIHGVREPLDRLLRIPRHDSRDRRALHGAPAPPTPPTAADLPIDKVWWWKDMAGRTARSLAPGCSRVPPAALSRPDGRAAQTRVRSGAVDSDGNPHDIVANWFEEGVNVMFPL